MVVLHRPNWRKFLVLRSEPNGRLDVPTEEQTVGDLATSSPKVVEPASTPKKRKRTEEEIAARKDKKLKSKKKEGADWKQLSETHQVSGQSKANESKSATELNEAETTTKLSNDGSNSKSEQTLLSMKARQIVNALRDEKVQEERKPSKKRIKENMEQEKKAQQALEYLHEYRAHINSGSAWKFKKQQQNWIVKQLYIFPWKDDDLVIHYLKTVQGGTRARLIEEAKKIVEDKEGTHGKDVIQRAESLLEALNT